MRACVCVRVRFQHVLPASVGLSRKAFFPGSFISKLHMNICSFQGENDSSWIDSNNKLGSAK